jgi:UDP-2,3-diacylglucosamine hydrolase
LPLVPVAPSLGAVPPLGFPAPIAPPATPVPQGPRVVVVADAHLGQVPAATEAAFHTFLERVPQPGDHLLIDGDLFDFWFEYGAVIPRKHFASVTKLAALRARGVAITFVGGNHDRWGGRFLTDDLGIAFSSGETEVDLAGRRAFVAHGDGLTEQHWSAKLMHRVTRHPLTAWTFRHLPPDLGFWIAGKLSGTLADTTKDRAVLDRAAAAQRDWACDLLRRRPELDLVVMAHTHRPQLETLPDGRAYLNPGAFLDGGRYAIITRETVELKSFGS